MKMNVLLSGLAIMTCVVSAPFFFSSCQQEDAFTAPTSVKTRSTAPEVPANLEVGEGYEVSYHTYAKGVQVYVCTETYPGVYAWIFKEPIATLYKEAGYNSVVGTHYAGPTWESNSGSMVVASKLEGATVDPNAVPWLKLGAVTTSGPGIFEGTTHIQRVNTVGGKAPATGAEASTVGMEIHVPYTAEYYFYKPE